MDSEESPVVDYRKSEINKTNEIVPIYDYISYVSIFIIILVILYNSYICFCDNQNKNYIEFDEDNDNENFVENFVEDLKIMQNKNIS